jgi:hypothetical protein
LRRTSIEHFYSDAEQDKQAGYVISAQTEGAWKHGPATLTVVVSKFCRNMEILCPFAHSRAKVYLLPFGKLYGRKVNSPILFLEVLDLDLGPDMNRSD